MFIDAYQKGLDGVQAAWAIKQCRGHCILPESIMKEFDDLHCDLAPLILSELFITS
jgi:hypothetical protein